MVFQTNVSRHKDFKEPATSMEGERVWNGGHGEYGMMVGQVDRKGYRHCQELDYWEWTWSFRLERDYEPCRCLKQLTVYKINLKTRGEKEQLGGSF